MAFQTLGLTFPWQLLWDWEGCGNEETGREKAAGTFENHLRTHLSLGANWTYWKSIFNTIHLKFTDTGALKEE